MTSTTQKMLLTLLATVAGSMTQVPGLPPLVAIALGSLAGFLAGWAHMDKPGQAS